jgi:hypothetical protein
MTSDVFIENVEGPDGVIVEAFCYVPEGHGFEN